MVWNNWNIEGIVYCIFRQYGLDNYKKGQEYLIRLCSNELKKHPKIKEQIKTLKQLEFFVIQMALENIKEIAPKIEFKAGYYEWNLYIDDILIYTFGADVSEGIDDNIKPEEFKLDVGIYVDSAIDELEEQESKNVEIVKTYKENIIETMFSVWSQHFGI